MIGNHPPPLRLAARTTEAPMTHDLHDEDARERLWQEIEDARYGMLGGGAHV